MKENLMTHLVCWYPSLKESEEILKTLSKYSKYIEVQFPFSDPIADWPIISKANDISLKNWITTQDCFNFILENKKHINSNIIIMTYFNIIYSYWIEEFILEAKKSWVYGIIIPDIPFDETEFEQLIMLCYKYEINFIPVVSPWIEEKRLEKLSKIKSEIIYTITKRMTTWSKFLLLDDFEIYIKILRKYFTAKIATWFWIASKEDISNVLKYCDIAVIWSEIIRRYNEKSLKWIDDLFTNNN